MSNAVLPRGASREKGPNLLYPIHPVKSTPENSRSKLPPGHPNLSIQHRFWYLEPLAAPSQPSCACAAFRWLERNAGAFVVMLLRARVPWTRTEDALSSGRWARFQLRLGLTLPARIFWYGSTTTSDSTGRNHLLAQVVLVLGDGAVPRPDGPVLAHQDLLGDLVEEAVHKVSFRVSESM